MTTMMVMMMMMHAAGNSRLRSHVRSRQAERRGGRWLSISIQYQQAAEVAFSGHTFLSSGLV